ncbi:MAG: PAS domain S-box protein [Hormoscilla sp.]
MNKRAIKVLILEDSPEDAELMVYELRRCGFELEWQRVERKQDYEQAIASSSFDIIITDYSLPGFDAKSALQILRSRSLDIPSIIVSGTISDEVAVECMKLGAADYLLKDRMIRLPKAIEQAIEASELRKAKRQAEMALQESEARFRRLAENAADIIYRLRVDPNLVFEYISPALEAITGYYPGELYADPQLWLAMLHPDDSKGWQQWLTTSQMFSQQPYVVRMFSKNGASIWLELRETPIYDRTGKLSAIEGIARDVSDRQQILLALHESAVKYRKLFEYANDSIFIIDPQTYQIIDVNENAAKQLGYTRSELQKCNIDQISPPDAAARNEIIFQELLKKGSVLYEQVHRHADGRLIPVEISSRVIESGGKQVFQSFVRDITERQIFIDVLQKINEELEQRVEERTAQLRSSEEKFRQLAENIRQVFWMTTSDRTQMLYVSPAYEEIWGRSCSSLYHAPDSWIESVHPDDRTSVADFIAKQCQGEHIREEFQIVRSDGSIHWIGARSFPIYNEEGKFYRIAGIAEDITDRKLAEAEIYKALAKEKELAELRSRFVAMTSHEFRTPLSTILSAAELLEYYSHKWKETEKKAQLHQIKTAVKQMTQLLEDVMLIGKSDTGKLPFNPEWVEVKDFCQVLVKQLQLSGQQHEIVFNCQELHNEVYLDKKLLRQILTNLLSNAIEYSPEGGVVLLEINRDDEWVIFVIRDSGIGIPAKDLPNLFEAFYRCSNVKAIAGTGLGLAIVKKFVDIHGGTIDVQSAEGEGTTFTVKLPGSAD